MKPDDRSASTYTANPETRTKRFNENQKKLQEIILKKERFGEAVALIKAQLAMTHASDLFGTSEETAEDLVWSYPRKENFRLFSEKSLYSPAWHLWHSARIEDIAISLLVRNDDQVLDNEGFFSSMKVPFRDTGNGMNVTQMDEFNRAIDLESLREYRRAVGLKSRDTVERLTYETVSAKVDPGRIRTVAEGGNVTEGSKWLLEFWGRKKIAGIITMPMTRHMMVHLNECGRKLK